ncbi:MAG: glycosyltransferase family 4 protein, partial [Candidatus Eisenbacteria bacterium]|nr:glycosyltransferase family 4 protein [Candidatus Eisenbacteria bacterium]
LMQAIDCLCLPSRMEGLPYVVLEGLAAGVPIVATPAGGVGEALAGDVLGRGCLPWDPGTWAARVRDLSAAEARANWSRAAHAGLLAFTEDEMLSRLAAIYRGRPVGAAQGTEERPRPPVQRRVEP